MPPTPPARLRRRFLLGAPALVTAALALTARPAHADTRTAERTVECVADLLVP